MQQPGLALSRLLALFSLVSSFLVHLSLGQSRILCPINLGHQVLHDEMSRLEKMMHFPPLQILFQRGLKLIKINLTKSLCPLLQAFINGVHPLISLLFKSLFILESLSPLKQSFINRVHP